MTMEAELGGDTTKPQGRPRISSKHQKLDRGKNGFSTTDFRGSNALSTT